LADAGSIPAGSTRTPSSILMLETGIPKDLRSLGIFLLLRPPGLLPPLLLSLAPHLAENVRRYPRGRRYGHPAHAAPGGVWAVHSSCRPAAHAPRRGRSNSPRPTAEARPEVETGRALWRSARTPDRHCHRPRAPRP